MTQDPIVALIHQRLSVLAPEYIGLDDESAAHAGHVGAAGGGGHYALTVVSAQFSGLNPVARHRLVYSQLGDLIPQTIHALKLKACTPDEI